MIQRSWTAAVLVIVMQSTASAQVSGVKIVETGVNYPGIGLFTAFAGPSSISGATTSFIGQNASSQGVYTSTGGVINNVALTGTVAPGGGTFLNFNGLQIGQSGDRVSFMANGGSPNLGLYSNVNGTLQNIVSLGQNYVGGSGFFNSLSVPSTSGTLTVFGGSSAPASALGIFARDGSNPIEIVANTSTQVPGTAANFTTFSDPSTGLFVPAVSNANVVYGGQGGGRLGIFARINGTHTAVATNITPAPAGTGNFTSFQFLPEIDGSTVAFSAVSPGRSGVYLWTPGSGLSRVADTTTLVPGGGGLPFTSFGFPANAGCPISLDSGHIAFVGTYGGQLGIFSDFGGTLQKVIRVSDTLDGKVVTNLTMSNNALSGNQLTATLRFSDNSQAVYNFTPVPEPAISLILLSSTGLLLQLLHGSTDLEHFLQRKRKGQHSKVYL